jgi:hypothetical protein
MYSLTVFDLPLSLLPPSQEYPYLGIPTLGIQQNTTVTEDSIWLYIYRQGELLEYTGNKKEDSSRDLE